MDKDKWLIWSNEHRAFWRPGQCGYTYWVSAAGRYSFSDAFSICMGGNFPAGADSYPIDPDKRSINGHVINEVMCPSREMIDCLLQQSSIEDSLELSYAMKSSQEWSTIAVEQKKITNNLEQRIERAVKALKQSGFRGYPIADALKELEAK